MINKDKHQPVMPTPVPAGASKKQERVIQSLESEQQIKTNENRAKPTPEQSASPQGTESKKPDAMDLDNDGPSMAQLEGEIDTEDTLEEPMPGQSSDKGGYNKVEEHPSWR